MTQFHSSSAFGQISKPKQTRNEAAPGGFARLLQDRSARALSISFMPACLRCSSPMQLPVASA
ncbi:unnamed protein product, partial [Protopolystoma xenopodis]